jgi:hypothetical protein
MTFAALWDETSSAVGMTIPRTRFPGWCCGRYSCWILRSATLDDQFRSPVEEFDHSFERMPVNHVQRTRTIRASRIVAEIDKGIARQFLPDFTGNAQSAEAGVKESQHAFGFPRFRRSKGIVVG